MRLARIRATAWLCSWEIRDSVTSNKIDLANDSPLVTLRKLAILILPGLFIVVINQFIKAFLLGTSRALCVCWGDG